MGLCVVSLAAAVQRAHTAMGELEQLLNEADAKLGDGDTGSMLARVFDQLASVDQSDQTDVGAAFRAYAVASMAATGSSLGTLFGTALMTIGREVKGTETVAWSRLPRLLAAACDAMAARGGAKLGDKTVLDVIDAVATAIEGCDEPGTLAAAAVEAAQHTLDTFRSKPCGVGRARMFAEKSIGLDDPGMLAFVRLTEAITVGARDSKH